MALPSAMATGADEGTKALALIFWGGLDDEFNIGMGKLLYSKTLMIHILG